MPVKYDLPQPEEKPVAVITALACVPQDEETERFRKLIGCPLTRIELREGGAVYLEFDPYGSITIKTITGVDLGCALAPDVQPRGKG